MDSSPPTPIASHIRCEDGRTIAAVPFSGGTKEAKPTEIQHVFQFSSLSDTPGVSTVRTPQGQRNTPPSLKSFNAVESRAGGASRRSRQALGAPRRNLSSKRRFLRAGCRLAMRCCAGVAGFLAQASVPQQSASIAVAGSADNCGMESRAESHCPHRADDGSRAAGASLHGASRSMTSTPSGGSKRKTASAGCWFVRTSLNVTSVTFPSRSKMVVRPTSPLARSARTRSFS